MSNVYIEIIENFVKMVEFHAEAKMIKTGKLEGAHYAAMKELLAKMKTDPQEANHET